MSMRTYLLLLYERETGMDYWVDAITNRGLSILRDDFLGACKFCGLTDETMAEAVSATTGLDIDVPTLQRVVRRSFLRGYRLERRQGFTDDDYVLPVEAHQEYPQIEVALFQLAGVLRGTQNTRDVAIKRDVSRKNDWPKESLKNDVPELGRSKLEVRNSK